MSSFRSLVLAWQLFRDGLLDFVVGLLVIGLWLAIFAGIPAGLLYLVLGPTAGAAWVVFFAGGVAIKALANWYVPEVDDDWDEDDEED